METSKRMNYIFAGLLALAGLVFVWRAFYGVNYYDEMYYAACLSRLFQGDAYLVHDWGICVMSCIPIYPFYLLYHCIVGSNEGVILFLRILYVAFQLLVAFVCFRRLKKFGWGALLAAVVYLLFTPFNIATMSYNTMALGFAMLTFALLTGPKTRPRRDYILCGICLAFCILSNPFAIVLYFIYGLVCAVQALLRRKKKCEGWEEFYLTSFFWISVGAFLIFIVFSVMLFRRASLSELADAFIYNFRMPGYEQNPGDFFFQLSEYVRKVHKAFPLLVRGTALIWVISLLDKKRTKHAFWYILPCSLLVLRELWLQGFVSDYVPTNYAVMPLAFLGFLCFWLLPKKEWRCFWLWFVPGILYSFCTFFASNTGILAITSAYVLCSSVSAVFLYVCARELWQNRRETMLSGIAAGCIAAVLAAHILVAAFLRITFFYTESPFPELTAKVTVGPAKGLYTTEGMASFHDERVRGLQSLNLTEEDYLLVPDMEPWAYLCTEARMASYTPWGDLDDTMYRIYLDVFPERYPNVVYTTRYEENMQTNSFLQELPDKGYETVTLESAVVLRKK